ncbi:multidrug transporter MATE [Clostridium botulinum]|nr:multidrug transporter MATE [Clostridium botulinum]
MGAIEQPFIAASTVVEDILKGMGDAKTPFIVTLISSWCIRVPLFYYYIYKLKYSVVCVWWITAFQWFIDFLLMKIILKKNLINLNYNFSVKCKFNSSYIFIYKVKSFRYITTIYLKFYK